MVLKDSHKEIADKLKDEGKYSTMPSPFTPEKTKEFYYKQKKFEFANYIAGYNTRNVVLIS